MKNIERELRRQAHSILPGDDVRTNIKRELGIPDEELSRAVIAEPVFAGNSSKSAAKVGKGGRRRNIAAVACCLLLCLSLGLGLYLGLRPAGEGAVSDTYLTMSINPSFGISVGSDDIVKSVTPLNQDAVIVVYGVEFAGMRVDEAVTEIARLCADLGYLDTVGGQVSVVPVNNNASKEKAVGSAVLNALTSAFSANGWQAGVAVKSSTDNKTMRKLNVTAGKAELIEEVCALTGMDKKEAALLSADSLAKLLNAYDAAYMSGLNSKLEASYETAVGEIMDAINGERKKQRELQNDLEKLVDKIDDIEDMFDDDNTVNITDIINTVGRIIREFKDKYADYDIGIDVEDLVNIGLNEWGEVLERLDDYFEYKLEQLEDELELKEEEYESKLGALKLQWKIELDDDDDDDDD